MSVNQEALQKLLIEMDTQLQKTQAELQMCNVQIGRYNSNVRITELTIQELNDASDETPIWQGVGKMFKKIDRSGYLKELDTDKKEYLDTLKSLGTKKTYLETTLEKTVDNMNQFMKGPK